MELGGGGFFETFLDGTVDRVIYRDYIVNRRFFFFFTVVWPMLRACATTLGSRISTVGDPFPSLSMGKEV